MAARGKVACSRCWAARCAIVRIVRGKVLAFVPRGIGRFAWAAHDKRATKQRGAVTPRRKNRIMVDCRVAALLAMTRIYMVSPHPALRATFCPRSKGKEY
jgi:hypothetical protein